MSKHRKRRRYRKLPTVVARDIIIPDGHMRPRIRLHCDQGNEPRIELFDTQGNSCLVLKLTSASVETANGEGRVSVERPQIAMTGDGDIITIGEGALSIEDVFGCTRVDTILTIANCE